MGRRNRGWRCIRRSPSVILLACLYGCTTVDGPSNTVIPNQVINVSRSVSISAENAVIGALAFVAIDPLAPNWQIAEAALGEGRYHIVMRKKRFTIGGDGEARPIFLRRLAEIARERGFTSWQILEFVEGIESNTPIAQRYSMALVQFRRDDRR